MLRCCVNTDNQLNGYFGRCGDFILSANLAWVIKIECSLARHLIVTKSIAHAYIEHMTYYHLFPLGCAAERFLSHNPCMHEPFHHFAR